MRSDALLTACDALIVREDGGDLLRRLLYARLGITAPMSNVEIGIALDEVCDRIRDHATDLDSADAKRADMAADDGDTRSDYERGGGAA